MNDFISQPQVEELPPENREEPSRLKPCEDCPLLFPTVENCHCGCPLDDGQYNDM